MALNDSSKILDFKVDVDSGQDKLEADLCHVARELAPSVFGSDVKNRGPVSKVTGGITNALYKVCTTDNKCVLVRIYGENTEVLIDRERENAVFAELSRKKLGPTYFGRFKNGRVEGYLKAEALTPDEMSQTSPVNIVSLIAAAMAEMHMLDISVEVAGPKEPQLWPTFHQYLDLASAVSYDAGSEKHAKLQELNLPKVASELESLEREFPKLAHTDSAGQSKTGLQLKVENIMAESVFAHNDMLGGNILLPQPPERVWLIDFEYSCYNYRSFDLANHWCEHAGFDCNYVRGYPSDETQKTFLRGYLEHACPGLVNGGGDADLVIEYAQKVVNRYALASHLFWCIWAVVQSRYSAVDFDYLGYALLRYRGYEEHKSDFLS